MLMSMSNVASGLKTIFVFPTAAFTLNNSEVLKTKVILCEAMSCWLCISVKNGLEAEVHLVVLP